MNPLQKHYRPEALAAYSDGTHIRQIDVVLVNKTAFALLSLCLAAVIGTAAFVRAAYLPVAEPAVLRCPHGVILFPHAVETGATVVVLSEHRAPEVLHPASGATSVTLPTRCEGSDDVAVRILVY